MLTRSTSIHPSIHPSLHMNFHKLLLRIRGGVRWGQKSASSSKSRTRIFHHYRMFSCVLRFHIWGRGWEMCTSIKISISTTRSSLLSYKYDLFEKVKTWLLLWTRLKWFRIGPGGSLLWTWQQTFGVDIRPEITWPDEGLSKDSAPRNY
jgi:hypothetical protein